MNTLLGFSTATHGNAFSASLSIDTLRERVPAVFAPSAHERMSAKYTFIPTERVLTGLMRVGFVPVDARQTRAGTVCVSAPLVRRAADCADRRADRGAANLEPRAPTLGCGGSSAYLTA
jgi:hypothetical protein